MTDTRTIRCKSPSTRGSDTRRKICHFRPYRYKNKEILKKKDLKFFMMTFSSIIEKNKTKTLLTMCLEINQFY